MDIGEKSREKLRVFVKKQLLAIQQDMLSRLPENTDIDLPDIPEVLVDQALELYIGTSNRQLYDFLDENNLFVLIDKLESGFLYTIKNENKIVKEGGGAIYFKTRPEIEKVAFEEAFKILENKL